MGLCPSSPSSRRGKEFHIKPLFCAARFWRSRCTPLTGDQRRDRLQGQHEDELAVVRVIPLGPQLFHTSETVLAGAFRKIDRQASYECSETKDEFAMNLLYLLGCWRKW